MRDLQKNKIDICIKKYKELQNLKLVAQETGIPWQTVYWYLKKGGIEVTGNKNVYGTTIERFGYRGEEYFQEIVPNAINQNNIKFQSKIDFVVGNNSIDIKSAKFKHDRWAFTLIKQIKEADFFVLLAYCSEGKEVQHHFLIPNEMLRKSLKTISIPLKVQKSKWHDFIISKEDIKEFFEL